MDVWIVEWSPENEHSSDWPCIMKVFSSKELADEYIAKENAELVNDPLFYNGSYGARKFTVDA